MKRSNKLIQLFLLACLLGCSGKTTSAGDSEEQKVLIKTTYGDMVVKLYNETPQHRDNFVKLVKEGFYDELLFHRVIKNFMIQGGDPDSKDAPASQHLGGGGPGYTLPAEIVDGIYHKKGALAAARQGDNANPERRSSGSQFYIVQGKVLNNEQLKQFEEKQKFQEVRKKAMQLYQEKMPDIQRLQKEGKMDSLSLIRIEIQEQAEQMVDSSMYQINEERKEIYTSVGGTPHLDGAYTVFGEVIDGFAVIDSIANVETGQGDRPVENLIMEMEMID